MRRRVRKKTRSSASKTSGLAVASRSKSAASGQSGQSAPPAVHDGVLDLHQQAGNRAVESLARSPDPDLRPTATPALRAATAATVVSRVGGNGNGGAAAVKKKRVKKRVRKRVPRRRDGGAPRQGGQQGDGVLVIGMDNAVDRPPLGSVPALQLPDTATPAQLRTASRDLIPLAQLEDLTRAARQDVERFLSHAQAKATEEGQFDPNSVPRQQPVPIPDGPPADQLAAILAPTHADRVKAAQHAHKKRVRQEAGAIIGELRPEVQQLARDYLTKLFVLNNIKHGIVNAPELDPLSADQVMALAIFLDDFGIHPYGAGAVYAALDSQVKPIADQVIIRTMTSAPIKADFGKKTKTARNPRAVGALNPQGSFVSTLRDVQSEAPPPQTDAAATGPLLEFLGWIGGVQGPSPDAPPSAIGDAMNQGAGIPDMVNQEEWIKAGADPNNTPAGEAIPQGIAQGTAGLDILPALGALGMLIDSVVEVHQAKQVLADDSADRAAKEEAQRLHQAGAMNVTKASFALAGLGFGEASKIGGWVGTIPSGTLDAMAVGGTGNALSVLWNGIQTFRFARKSEKARRRKNDLQAILDNQQTAEALLLRPAVQYATDRAKRRHIRTGVASAQAGIGMVGAAIGIALVCGAVAAGLGPAGWALAGAALLIGAGFVTAKIIRSIYKNKHRDKKAAEILQHIVLPNPNDDLRQHAETYVAMLGMIPEAIRRQVTAEETASPAQFTTLDDYKSTDIYAVLRQRMNRKRDHVADGLIEALRSLDPQIKAEANRVVTALGFDPEVLRENDDAARALIKRKLNSWF